MTTHNLFVILQFHVLPQPPDTDIIHDWAGFMLMFFNLSIVLMWKSIRSDTKIVLALWFCIMMHSILVFYNSYAGTIIGGNMDAASFHHIAHRVSEAVTYNQRALFSAVGVYTHFYGFFYWVFGTSLLLGGELSVLAFTLTSVVLVKLIDLLDLRRHRIWIVLFFGLLPSAMFIRSVTLREVWQALFFLLSIYLIIRLRKRQSILTVLFLFISTFCMALLHHALIIYAVYLILIGVIWLLRGGNKRFRHSGGLRFLFAVLIFFCVIMLAQKMGWFYVIEHGLERTEVYRRAAISEGGRTFYGVMLDTSSVYGMVTTTIMVFFRYMFAPLPWDVGNAKDLISILETMLRLAFLFFAVSSWRRSSGEVRSCYGFLLIAVLGMEFMWSLGTVNWGTATRHHLIGYSVIALLGVPGLIQFMQKLHFGIFERGKDSIFQDRGKYVQPDPIINEMLQNRWQEKKKR